MNALIGMSGGVDSSVATLLMQQNGYICMGATMVLHPQGEGNVDDARSIAARMGIPFHIFDFSQEFKEAVMDHFARSYQAGLTPNPCIECNRHLKFDRFLQQARQLNCDCIATGHYARIVQLDNGRYCLRKAEDAQKDQTYFLYTLSQDQLAHTRFPLGELTKAQVRTIAEAHGFVNAAKRDSQDICFVPDGDYMTFLEQHTAQKSIPGAFLDPDGNVVGTHRGAAAYTLGQRKGLGLAMGTPVYVCSKNMANNTVTVGPNDALFHRELTAGDLNWMAIPELTAPIRCAAKARSRMTGEPATVYPDKNGRVRVVFDRPQRAITPGQAVVFYDGELVLGGGTILSL